MKITQLDIEGFRSLKKVSWKPGDLNVIIGPNGSGKSNLLRMLEMISVAVRSRLAEYIQAEGGISALVWDGQAESIRFALKTDDVHETHSILGLTYEVNLPHTIFDVALVRLGNGSAYRIQREVLFDIDASKPFIDRVGARGTVYDGDASFTVRVDSISDEELALPIASGPFSNSSEIPYIKAQLSSWAVYQNISLDRNASTRQSVVAKHETVVSSDGQNLINVLHTLYSADREFKQQVNSAMKAAFGDDFDELLFPPASDQRVQLRVRWKTLKREQSAADLSDGTLRFLFLLAVLASPNPAPLIAIDEPETGLHPSMLPIIAEFAVEAARKTQVIFTTHSDQFLDAFREARPTTTVAKWENGETTLTTLADEDLDYWLKDYSLGKMFRSGELEALA